MMREVRRRHELGQIAARGGRGVHKHGESDAGKLEWA